MWNLSNLLKRAAWVIAVGLAAVLIAGGVSYTRTRQVRESLYAAFTPVHITNCALQRFGDANDGGYLMCANFLPAAQAAYSYGIGGSDGWGCDVQSRLNVPLHQYDCFNTTRPACAAGTAMFHEECIGPVAATIDGRRFDTLANQIAANGDTGKRLIVKMDVEGAEWRTLTTAPDHVLEAIDQIVLEFHDVEDPEFLDTAARIEQFFHVANLHQNNWTCRPGYDPFPGPVFEALLVNKRLVVTDPSVAVRRGHPLDAPNNPTGADCQESPGGDEWQRVARWTWRKVREIGAIIRFWR